MITAEYDLAAIKARVKLERDTVMDWLVQGNRDTRIINCISVPVRIVDMEKMIDHIEKLTALLDDDFE